MKTVAKTHQQLLWKKQIPPNKTCSLKKAEEIRERKCEKFYLKFRDTRFAHARFTSRMLLESDKLMEDRWGQESAIMRTDRTFWQPTQFKLCNARSPLPVLGRVSIASMGFTASVGGGGERWAHKWSVTFAQPLRLMWTKCGQWARTPSMAFRPKLPYEMSSSWSSGSFLPPCKASRAVSSRYLHADNLKTCEQTNALRKQQPCNHLQQKNTFLSPVEPSWYYWASFIAVWPIPGAFGGQIDTNKRYT